MYLEPACSDGVKIGFPVLGQKIAQSERNLTSVEHQILGGRDQNDAVVLWLQQL